MRALLRPLYAATVAAARAAAAVAGGGSPSPNKVWRSVQARHDIVARWQRSAAAVRDMARPLVWMHAPSVGEGLQSRPVAHALRAAWPEAQLAYSFFSPSAEKFAASIGADLTGYLPFDSAAHMDALLDALRPSMLVFVKLDVWPVLVERATRRGIPVLMLSATLAESSGRRGMLSRALLHDAYAALSLVGVIDAEHGNRLVELGVPRANIRHTGDTRFDQVWQRAQQLDRTLPHMVATASSRPTLVAGSTWPADEAVLLPAWEQLRTSMPSARIMVAPHEPTAAHVEPLLAWAKRSGLRVATLSEAEAARANAASANAARDDDAGNDKANNADVVVIDRVGVLGDLYAHADVAFVGGGFHGAGLHSAIEPAAFGAPVLFGPGHGMSREAGLLLAAGGARCVHDMAECVSAMRELLQNGQPRRVTGDAAREIVARERGATERSVALLLDALRTDRTG